jgi:amino acid transporter, AAT family
VAVAGMFFVWGVILVTHIAFRRVLGPQRVAQLPMRMRFYPYSTLLGIVVLLGITLSTLYVDGLQYTVPAFVPFLLLVSVAYWRMQRKGIAAPAAETGNS